MAKGKKSQKKKEGLSIESAALSATRWIGSTASLVVHTIIFIGAFAFMFFGYDVNLILLVLTTVVSLEAIYLAIFIQMSVNRQDARLREVSEDVDEIAEDIDEIQEDVDEIQHDIDEIQEDVDEIQEDVEEIQEEEDNEPSVAAGLDPTALGRIEQSLRDLAKEISELKNK